MFERKLGTINNIGWGHFNGFNREWKNNLKYIFIFCNKSSIFYNAWDNKDLFRLVNIMESSNNMDKYIYIYSSGFFKNIFKIYT